MVRDPVLRRALILARRKKYDDAVKMLEAETFRYQDSYNYYHILGLVCLYAGDHGGAFTYFNRARNIKLRAPGALLGLAALFLRRGETGRALDLYLDVQDAEPGNALAQRGLAAIRRYGGTEEFAAWLNRGKLRSLYPPMPGAGIVLDPRPAAAILAAGAVLAGAAAGAKWFEPFKRGGLEASALEREEAENPVDMAGAGTYRYVLTRDEVLASYNEARRLFNRRRDEAAKRELNRIMNSNASAAVKNKAALLKGYTEAPGFDTLNDRFSYRDVAADPSLYRDCYVLWRGSAANVQTDTGTIRFDLLVGYDTRTVMEGDVAVELRFPAEINTALPLEVLGSVVPLGPGRFMLRGTGIHQGPAR
ncbi:MAG: tetratricopeptide repeat protein [Treponema sp.]|jgi:tetratricopeptide (TPR) repeat protein|nr:tetratricopeptide repeat protein [Treponema sp.]